MNEQKFIDLKMNPDETLAGKLESLVDQIREETGTYDVEVNQVLMHDQFHYTIIIARVASGW